MWLLGLAKCRSCRARPRRMLYLTQHAQRLTCPTCGARGMELQDAQVPAHQVPLAAYRAAQDEVDAQRWETMVAWRES